MADFRSQIVDLHQRRIFAGEVRVADGKIQSIEPLKKGQKTDGSFLMPGFVDAHVHVESSMLPPAEFGRVAVCHGTVATISDPHEIANVLGEPGLEFMLDDAARGCLPIFFGVPSCVPATNFETSGASLNSGTVERLLQDERFYYLSEMMNWPGVLNKEPEVMAKISAAHRLGKPVDGHAPGLRGQDAAHYAATGITTDHECFTLEEARDKAKLGMHILIREGSAARNLDAVWPILLEHPDLTMFSTDDAHPDDLLQGHVNRLVARCVAYGVDLFDVLRTACSNPVLHYGIPVGQLRVGDRADFIRVDDLVNFRVRETWINGERVAENGKCSLPHHATSTPNRFRNASFTPDDFRIGAEQHQGDPVRVRVIVAEDGELVTKETHTTLVPANQILEPDPKTDTLLLAVCNRYAEAPPALAFVTGFGLDHGAIASSIAHDSHQVIAVGTSREDISKAVNSIFECQGGLTAIVDNRTENLTLPIAGLMSDQPGHEVAERYQTLTGLAHQLGSNLQAPYMTLAFMALLVIPALKLSDRGLFDGQSFRFTQVKITKAEM